MHRYVVVVVSGRLGEGPGAASLAGPRPGNPLRPWSTVRWPSLSQLRHLWYGALRPSRRTRNAPAGRRPPTRRPRRETTALAPGSTPAPGSRHGAIPPRSTRARPTPRHRGEPARDFLSRHVGDCGAQSATLAEEAARRREAPATRSTGGWRSTAHEPTKPTTTVTYAPRCASETRRDDAMVALTEATGRVRRVLRLPRTLTVPWPRSNACARSSRSASVLDLGSAMRPSRDSATQVRSRTSEVPSPRRPRR